MNCKEFQESINDFIFDKIEYANDVETFVKHYRECKDCNHDLKLYYLVRRGLEDVECPLIDEKPKDSDEELDLIMSYYEEFFEKQKLNKKLFVSIGVIFGVIAITAIVLVLLDYINF